MANIWNMFFFCSPDIQILFESWIHLNFLYHQLQSWRLVFYALMWSIWTCSNQVIFRQEEFNSTTCLELFRYRFVWWSKNIWGNIVPSASDIYLNPDEVSIPLPPQPTRLSTLWVLPSLVSIKKLMLTDPTLLILARVELAAFFGTIMATLFSISSMKSH